LSKIQSFKDLLVWQKAMDLAVKLYEITATYPAEERFGLTSETRKTARSVPYNIAEGKARFSVNEYRHFVSIARGSLGELDTQIILAGRLKYLGAEAIASLEESVEEIARMLRGLEQSFS
jgi:four helix bundle protein